MRAPPPSSLVSLWLAGVLPEHRLPAEDASRTPAAGLLCAEDPGDGGSVGGRIPNQPFPSPPGWGQAQRPSLRSEPAPGPRRTTSPRRPRSAGGRGRRCSLTCRELTHSFPHLGFSSPAPSRPSRVSFPPLQPTFCWEAHRHPGSARPRHCSPECGSAGRTSTGRGHSWRGEAGGPHLVALPPLRGLFPEGSAHALAATPARPTSAPTVPREPNHGSQW